MISSFKQGELTVTNYFTQLKILWDELDLFCLLSTYSCASKCTCNSLVNVSKYKAQDQIIKFLRGLNDNYSTVRTQILLILAKEVIKTMLQPVTEVLDTEEEAMEDDILPKFAVIVERQYIPLIHAIKSMTFHLISSLKIRIMIKVIRM